MPGVSPEAIAHWLVWRDWLYNKETDNDYRGQFGVWSRCDTKPALCYFKSGVCVWESLVLCGCVRWQQQLQQYCKILEKCRTHCISSRGLYCFIWTHIRSALTAYFCVSLSHFKGSIKWLLDWQVPQWFECFIRETAWCWVTSGVVWILNKSIADILVLVYII